MKRVKRKRPLVEPAVLGSLVRVPPLESARAHAAGDQSVAELKTTRLPKKQRCPICGVRVAEAEVQIGFVILKVCGACADPVLFGLKFIGSLKRFL